MKIKRGIETTEFISLMVLNILGIAVALRLLTMEQAAELVPYIVSLIGLLIFAGVRYIEWRNKLKLELLKQENKTS